MIPHHHDDGSAKQESVKAKAREVRGETVFVEKKTLRYIEMDNRRAPKK